MSARRIAALFRRVTEEIRRDRPSLGLLFVAPIILTGLITFILREGDTAAVDALLVNRAGQAGTFAASALRTSLEKEGGSLTVVPDEATARAEIRDGKASIAIVLPADLAGSPAPRIALITNGLDPSGESRQIGALQQSLLAMAASSGAHIPSIEHQTVWGTPSNDPITSFAPAIVGFFAYFFVYILTGVSFLRERTGGTLERLMATPVARGEIVAGYTLGFGLFAVVQVAILMTWALGRLDVPALGPLPPFSVGLGIAAAGSPLVAFLVVILLALGAVNLGIFLSTFARTELQIIQFIPIVLVPQFLLSGVIFPVSSLPGIIRPLAAILPVTYAVDGLRQVFIRGADLSVGALQVDLVVLAVIALFFATIASLTIRREIV